MGNKVVLLIFMYLPAVIAGLAMYFLRDALTTLLLLIAFYLIAMFVYDKAIENFGFETKLAKEALKLKENIFKGLISGLGAAFAIPLILVVYCMFLGYGWDSITFPLPKRDQGAPLQYVDFGLLVVLYLIEGAVQHLFFNFFVASEYNEKGGMAGLAQMASGEVVPASVSATISLGVALLTGVVFYFILGPWWLSIIVALLMFGINYYLIQVRAKDGIIVSTFIKLGISLGVALFILFMLGVIVDLVQVKGPQLIKANNPKNIWNKVFSGGSDKTGGNGSGKATLEKAKAK